MLRPLLVAFSRARLARLHTYVEDWEFEFGSLGIEGLALLTTGVMGESAALRCGLAVLLVLATSPRRCAAALAPPSAPFPMQDDGTDAVMALVDGAFGTQTAADGGDRATWVIEFYAPWCGHCAKLLPRMEAAARAARMRGLHEKLRFGKVECDANPKLKDFFGVSSFPTVLLFERGHGSTDFSSHAAKEYVGARTFEALQDLALRLSRPPVLKLPPSSGTSGTLDLAAWAREVGSEGGVAFVLIGDAEASGTAAAPAAESLRRAFHATAKGLRDQLTFASFAVPSEGLAMLRTMVGAQGAAAALLGGVQPPFVARLEAGDPDAMQVLTSADLLAMAAAIATGGSGSGSGSAASPVVYRVKSLSKRKVAPALSAAVPTADAAAPEALRGWALHWRFPTLAHLTTESFSLAANNAEGRFLALVCDAGSGNGGGADEAGSEKAVAAGYVQALRRLASPAASTLPLHVRDRFLFATIEFEPFKSFLAQFGAQCPMLLVLDAPQKSFWHDRTVQEEPDMETWLADIAAGRAPMQRQGMLSVPQQVANVIGLRAVYALGGLCICFLFWLVWSLVLREALGFAPMPAAEVAEGAATAAVRQERLHAAASRQAKAESALLDARKAVSAVKEEGEGGADDTSAYADSAAPELRRRL